jgi:hypothetical protein
MFSPYLPTPRRGTCRRNGRMTHIRSNWAKAEEGAQPPRQDGPANACAGTLEQSNLPDFICRN